MKIHLTLLLSLLAAAGASAQVLPPPMQPGGPANAASQTNRLELLKRLRMSHLHQPRTTAPGMPGMPGLPGAGLPVPAAAPAAPPATTANVGSGATAGTSSEEMIPAGTIDFQGVDVSQVLDVYAQLVDRTILRSQLPEAKIVLRTQTPLTKSETIQALQAVLALNGISIVNIGDKFVKAVQSDQANTAGAEFNHDNSTNLPNLGSYITRIVQMKYVKPTEILPIIQPFGKLQNSAVAFDSTGILVLRDYAENVKRMLELIEQIDVNIPEEYTSEVIPIKYAQAADIAGALNSLGGAGGSTVSFGTSAMGSINGTHSVGGGGSSFGGGSSYGGGGGGYNGLNSSGSSFGNRSTSAFGGGSAFGGASPNGTASGGTTFAQRLNSIVNAASQGTTGAAAGGGKEPIQVFGQAKIIADQRSNALLVFATKQDMVNIKHVINELDVLLAQVLIESVILDVNLNKAFQFSLSAAQNPHAFGGSTPTAGGGGFNNSSSSSPFINMLNSGTNGYSLGTNSATSLFGNQLGSGGGLQYFGNIGPTWDIAMDALQSDSTANVIQKPRIQTSQAKAASFFVGETVPYVTGTYYGGGYSGGNSSQYSQLSVGVELDVTPFINPDGLVVMDISQEIDDIAGYTQIDGNPVPNTTKRTLTSEIAVRNKDTIILGGFVRDEKDKSKSGVPLLMDIPLLGNLFTSRSDTKAREELLVLMRPTVLKTPDAASDQTLTEERRLPGVSAAQSDDAVYERSLIDAQRKLEKQRAKHGDMNGYYNSTTTMDPTNAPATGN